MNTYSDSMHFSLQPELTVPPLHSAHQFPWSSVQY
jgi:hypothetical protein